MAVMDTYTKSGTKASTKTSVPKNIAGIKDISAELLKTTYLTETNNQRQTSASVKNRSAVRGGGRKPWRQKGTGRARAGTIRSPLWRGGGVVFGPSDKVNFSSKTNKKTKQSAFGQALAAAIGSGRVSVIEKLELKNGKTSELAVLLLKLDKSKAENILLIVDTPDEKLLRAGSNLNYLTIAQAGSVSVKPILDATSIIITKPALQTIDARLAKSEGGAK